MITVIVKGLLVTLAFVIVARKEKDLLAGSSGRHKKPVSDGRIVPFA